MEYSFKTPNQRFKGFLGGSALKRVWVERRSRIKYKSWVIHAQKQQHWCKQSRKWLKCRIRSNKCNGSRTLLSHWTSYLLERNVSQKAIKETQKDQSSDYLPSKENAAVSRASLLRPHMWEMHRLTGISGEKPFGMRCSAWVGTATLTSTLSAHAFHLLLPLKDVEDTSARGQKKCDPASHVWEEQTDHMNYYSREHVGEVSVATTSSFLSQRSTDVVLTFLNSLMFAATSLLCKEQCASVTRCVITHRCVESKSPFYCAWKVF